MPALLIATDLMTTSSADGAARRAGVELTTAAPATSVEAATGAEPRLIAIDLTAPIADVAALVAALRDAAPGAALLAFGPHVHEAKLQAARDAGCDRVVSRGQFHKGFADLLTRYAIGGGD